MELKQYISPLLKWWWLILGSTLVATLASIYAVSQQPDLYQARSALMLGQAMNDPNPNSQDFFLANELGQTYVNIAQREPVQNATMAALGLTWLPNYTVNMVPNTQLLEIRVNDTSPERATAVANELANQIVLSSPTSRQEQEDQERQAFIRAQLDDMQAQIDATNEQILALETELGEMISARQIADAQAQIGALDNKMRTLQTNYVDLLYTTQQGAINSLTVFEEAAVPTLPVGPNRLSTVLTAAAIGFVLGAAAAYLLEYLDDTVKTPDDVSQVVDLPTLAGIARIPKDRNQRFPMVTLRQPRSPISEAYRTLRTAIMFTNVDRPTNSILVTSANPAEGKSITAANMAVVMAQAGNRVLLVDADLRRPMQHNIFGLNKNQQGLTSVLLKMIVEQRGHASPEDVFELLEGAIHETEQQELFLLTSGPLPPNPAELVGSTKMDNLLEVLAEYFDVVVVDSPPVLAVTDSVVLSTLVDGTLLVGYSGKTRRNQLEQAALKLKEVNAHIMGLVLNYLSPKSGGYYYNYYYSDTYYHDDSAGDGANSGKSRRRRKGRKDSEQVAQV